jgi:hypothetical protein
LKRDLLIAAIATAMVAAISYGAALTGTNVAAPVVPFTDADTYPSHEAKYGKGGYIQAQSTSVTHVPLTRRADGMMVYATQWGKYYRLASGVWQQQTFIQQPQFGNLSTAVQAKINNIPAGPQGPRGYDGYDGNSHTCAILYGPQQITYDANGLLPAYNTAPYNAMMYRNGVMLDPSAYAVHWWSNDGWSHVVGSPNGLITTKSWAPTVLGAYSSSKFANFVFAKFSSGEQKCVATSPVAVSKIGNKGDKGDPGDLSNLTRLNVTNVLDDASDVMVSLQPATNSGTVPMIGIRDYAGNVRNYTDAAGYQYFKAANGAVLTKIMTDGTILIYDPSGIERVRLDNLGKLTLRDSANRRRVFLNATTGGSYTLRTYRGDGTTVAFEVYTSGRINQATGGGSGTPGGSNKQIQYNSNGSFAGAAYFNYSAWANGTGGTVIIR